MRGLPKGVHLALATAGSTEPLTMRTRLSDLFDQMQCIERILPKTATPVYSRYAGRFLFPVPSNAEFYEGIQMKIYISA